MSDFLRFENKECEYYCVGASSQNLFFQLRKKGDDTTTARVILKESSFMELAKTLLKPELDRLAQLEKEVAR